MFILSFPVVLVVLLCCEWSVDCLFWSCGVRICRRCCFRSPYLCGARSWNFDLVGGVSISRCGCELCLVGIRHHATPRTTLFTPTHGPGHPPISTLEPHRTTITHNNFGEVSQHKDDWAVVGNAALPFQWKGTTRFTVKKDYEHIQENHDEEQQHELHEAHRARGLRQPQQPTPQQIAEHNVTHLPYRN